MWAWACPRPRELKSIPALVHPGVGLHVAPRPSRAARPQRAADPVPKCDHLRRRRRSWSRATAQPGQWQWRDTAAATEGRVAAARLRGLAVALGVVRGNRMRARVESQENIHACTFELHRIWTCTLCVCVRVSRALTLLSVSVGLCVCVYVRPSRGARSRSSLRRGWEAARRR